MNSTAFLSFNTQLPERADLTVVECVDEDAASSENLPLQYTWKVWEQVIPTQEKGDYSENTKAIASISTVQEFWQLWNSLPQPSELLGSKRMVRDGESDGAQLVDAIMIFRDGIKPMWEDSMNSIGGHFDYKFRPTTGGSQIDEYWNNLVLGMVGSTIDPASMITGVRLVDKLSGPRAAGTIRLEVWFTDFQNTEARERLRRNVELCMASKLDGSCGTRPSAEVKSHKPQR